MWINMVTKKMGPTNQFFNGYPEFNVNRIVWLKHKENVAIINITSLKEQHNLIFPKIRGSIIYDINRKIQPIHFKKTDILNPWLVEYQWIDLRLYNLMFEEEYLCYCQATNSNR